MIIHVHEIKDTARQPRPETGESWMAVQCMYAYVGLAAANYMDTRVYTYESYESYVQYMYIRAAY